MDRSVIVFHGTGADPGACWYPWLAARLADRGYAVEVPHYPGLNIEPIATVLQAAYDWAAIRAGARELYCINSVHDPYGCDDAQGRTMFDRVGGTQIVRDDGHFGDYDRPYETFELLDRLID
jgi:hypothetical protein